MYTSDTRYPRDICMEGLGLVYVHIKLALSDLELCHVQATCKIDRLKSSVGGKPHVILRKRMWTVQFITDRTTR